MSGVTMTKSDFESDKKQFNDGKPGPGRPKGLQNKTTSLLKDAILKAATEAGNGSLVQYLKEQAKDNPGPFMALLGKVLPLQVDIDAAIVSDTTWTVNIVAPAEKPVPLPIEQHDGDTPLIQ